MDPLQKTCNGWPRSFKVFRFDTSAVVGVPLDEMDVESVEVTAFTLPG